MAAPASILTASSDRGSFFHDNPLNQIVESAVAQLGRSCEFSSDDDKNVVLGNAAAKRYLVRYDGCNLRVAHSAWWRRVLAVFHTRWRVPKPLVETFRNYFLTYKSGIKANNIYRAPDNYKYVTHHANVMSIGVIPEYIDGERPLVIFDVDETLLITRGGWFTPKTQSVEGVGVFKHVIDSVRGKASNARFLFLTNGLKTRQKLSRAGIDFAKEFEILEKQAPEELGINTSTKEGEEQYKLEASHKGKRLQEYLNRNSGFDSIHFIDDTPSNLEDVAKEVNSREIDCHTYAFIGCADVSNYRKASQQQASDWVDMDTFYRDFPVFLHSAAAFNILKAGISR